MNHLISARLHNRGASNIYARLQILEGKGYFDQGIHLSETLLTLNLIVLTTFCQALGFSNQGGSTVC